MFQKRKSQSFTVSLKPTFCGGKRWTLNVGLVSLTLFHSFTQAKSNYRLSQVKSFSTERERERDHCVYVLILSFIIIIFECVNYLVCDKYVYVYAYVYVCWLFTYNICTRQYVWICEYLNYIVHDKFIYVHDNIIYLYMCVDCWMLCLWVLMDKVQ